MSQLFPLLDKSGMQAHLWEERHLQFWSYPSVHVDEVGRSATFMVNDLTGRFTGYQTYRPDREKIRANVGHGRYYSYANGYGVWGLESLQPGRPLAVVEGVFDAALLHQLGVSALAMMAHTPPVWFQWWLSNVWARQFPFVFRVQDGDGGGDTKSTKWEHPLANDLVAPSGEDMSSLGLQRGREFLLGSGVPLPGKPLDFLLPAAA